MKKITAFLMCILMVLSLTACGNEDTTTTTVPAASEEIVIPTEFEFGSAYGTSYSNPTMGIGISLPSEFVITSNAELAKLNSFDEELMTTNLPEAMENTLRAYIFVAMDDAGNYMNIIVENLKISGKTFITGLEYFENNTEDTKKDYEDMEAVDVTLTPSEVYIAGTRYDVELISYTLGGVSCTDTRIAFPAGNFMAVMTLKGDTSLILNRTYGL